VRGGKPGEPKREKKKNAATLKKKKTRKMKLIEREFGEAHKSEGRGKPP